MENDCTDICGNSAGIACGDAGEYERDTFRTLGIVTWGETPISEVYCERRN